MVLLNTHVWVWWVHGDTRLAAADRGRLTALAEADDFYVSAISAWEVAKLVEKGRLSLPVDVNDWFEAALDGSAVGLLELTPDVAAESTRLPGSFHTDPADQLIVATARIHNCALVTADRKIIEYEYVITIPVAQ